MLSNISSVEPSFTSYASSKLKQVLKRGLEVAPKQALIPFSKLPVAIQEKTLNFALKHMFSRQLQEGELDFMIDKNLRISITDAQYECYISVQQTTDVNSIELKLHTSQEADVCFEAESTCLLQLFGQTVDPDTLFFQRKLLVSGDTEIGLEIKNFLDDLDRDSLPLVVQKLINHYKALYSANE